MERGFRVKFDLLEFAHYKIRTRMGMLYCTVMAFIPQFNPDNPFPVACSLTFFLVFVRKFDHILFLSIFQVSPNTRQIPP